MNNKENKIITPQDAAILLDVPLSRIRSAVFRREIPYIKIGRLVHFDIESLRLWLATNTKQPLSEGRSK